MATNIITKTIEKHTLERTRGW